MSVFGETCYPTTHSAANKKYAELLKEVDAASNRAELNKDAAIVGLKVGTFGHIFEQAHDLQSGGIYKLTTVKNTAALEQMQRRFSNAVDVRLGAILPMDTAVLETKFRAIVDVSDRCSASDTKEVVGVDALWDGIRSKNENAKSQFVDDAVVAVDKIMFDAGHAQVDCIGHALSGSSKCTFHEMPSRTEFLNYRSFSKFLNSDENGAKLVEEARTSVQAELLAEKVDAAQLLRTVKTALTARVADATAQHTAHHLFVVQVQSGVLVLALVIYWWCGSRRGRNSGPCRRGGDKLGCDAGAPSTKYGRRTKFFV